MRMKLTVALSAAALALSLGLSACGGSSQGGGAAGGAASQASSTGDVWKISAETDDFGDEVEGGTPMLNQMFTGTFSNTATAESEFSGGVNIIWDNSKMDYSARFAIMEYEDNPMTYTGTSGMTLKMKGGDGTIHEYALEGTPPKGALRYDGANRLVFDLLKETGTVRCILEVESSKYEFELNCANFAEVFYKNRPDVLKLMAEGYASQSYNGTNLSTYTSKSVDEALGNIMPGKWKLTRQYAASYLMACAYDYESMTKEEINEVLPGTFATVELGGTANGPVAWTDIYISDMTPAQWTCTRMIEQQGDNDQQLISAKGTGLIKVGDGTMTQDGYVYDMRKIKDGYYLWRVVDTPSGINANTWSTFVLVYECDKEGNPTG